ENLCRAQPTLSPFCHSEPLVPALLRGESVPKNLLLCDRAFFSRPRAFRNRECGRSILAAFVAGGMGFHRFRMVEFAPPCCFDLVSLFSRAILHSKVGALRP